MEDTSENLEVPDVAKQAETSLEMEAKLPKSDYASSIHSEVSDEARELDALLNEGEMKLMNSGETPTDGQESVEESMETMLEALQKVESLIGMDIETSNIDSSILPVENEEQLDEAIYTEETSEAIISPIEMEIELSESKDVPLIQPETDFLKEQSTDSDQADLPRELAGSFDSQEKTDTLTKMEINVASNEEDLDTLTDLPEESKAIIKADVMLELSPEVSKNDKSPADMYVELTESEVETSLVFDENVDNFEEKLENSAIPKPSESPSEMEVELPKYEEESEILSEIKDETEEEKLDSQEAIDADLDIDKSLDIPPEMKAEVTEIEETLAGLEDPVEESMDTAQEEIFKTSGTPIVPTEQQEESQETISVLEPPERIESPIELSIKVPEGEDILTVQLEEKEDAKEEQENERSQPEEKLGSFGDSPKRSDSPLELLKSGDESTVPLDFQEEAKEADEVEDEPESPSESSKRTEAPVRMETVLIEQKEEVSVISMEKSEDSQENLEVFEESLQTDLLLEMRIGLTKTDDTSAVRPEIPDEPDCAEQKKQVDLSRDTEGSSDIPETKVTSRETPTGEQETVDESMETMLEALQKVESLIDMDLETSNIDEGSILSVEMPEHSEEAIYTEETSQAVVSSIEMDIELSENDSVPSVQPERQDLLKECTRDTGQTELQEELEASCDSQERTDTPEKMEIKVSDNEEDSITLKDVGEEKKEIIIKADVALELSSEISKDSKSPADMYVELTESEVETRLVFDETVEDFEEKSEIPKPNEMEVELSKYEDESVEEKPGETIDADLNANESFDNASEMKAEETVASVPVPVEESTETSQEQISKTLETPVASTEKQEGSEETDSALEPSERIESPFELSIKISEDEEISTTQSEAQVVAEEHKDDAELQAKETSCDSSGRTDSPSELFKTEDESIVPMDSQEETKEADVVEDKSESPKTIESPVEMEVELAEKKREDFGIPMEKPDEFEENQEDSDDSKQTDSSIETGNELPKVNDPSVVQPEVQDEPEHMKQEVNVDLTEDGQKSSKISEMKAGSEEIAADDQQPVEESMESMFPALQKVGLLIDVDIKASSIDNSSMLLAEKQEQTEDAVNAQEELDAAVASLEAEANLSERNDAALMSQEVQDDSQESLKLQEQWEASYNSLERADSPAKMEVEESNDEEDLATLTVLSKNSTEATETEDKLGVLPEISESPKSPTEMHVSLMETEVETCMMADEDSQDLEKLEIAEDSERSESPKEMEVELSKCEEERLVNQEPVDAISDADKLPETSTETKEATDLEETPAATQEPVEESVETTDESPNNTELPVNIKIKLSEFGKGSVTSVEKQESDEMTSVPASPKRIESPIEPKVKVSKGKDISIIQAEEQRDNVQLQSKEKLGPSCDASKRTNSPLGMKIKLSKTGDASIVPLDFHEEPKETVEKSEDLKENVEIPDVSKRTDSPLGMRIKLSKTGDASIIQSEILDDGKHTKHKERVDSSQDTGRASETSFGMKVRLINSEEATTFKEEQMEEPQEVVPKVESPIGMKIRFSKHGDASIVPSEKPEHPEEMKSVQETVKRTESPFETKIKEGQCGLEEHIRDNVHVEPKERLEACYSSPKRTNSPIGMKIKLFKSGDASIVPSTLAEESKETCKTKDRSVTSSEIPKRTESPIGMKIKLAKTKGGASIIPMETLEDPKENLELPDVSKRTESPLGMKIKLFKSGDASIVHSEGKIDSAHEALSGMKMKVIKSSETSSVSQEPPEEHMDAIPESWQKVESPIGMKIKLSKFGDVSIVPSEKQDHPEEAKSIQEAPKRTESPLGMKIRLSKTGDASIIQPEWTDHPEDHKEHVQSRPKEKLDASYDSPKRTGSPLGMKIKLSKTGDASIVSSDLPEESKATSKLKEKLESSPEVPKRTESPIGMKIKLAKTKSGAAIISMENPEDSREKLDVPDTPKRTESPLGMKIKLFKSGDASIVHSEIAEEVKDMKQKDKMDSREKIDATQDGGRLLETLSGMKIKMIKSGETSVPVQESTEEPVETIPESWQKVESPIGMKIKISKFGDASIVPVEREEQPEEVRHLQETPRRTESPLGMKIKLSKSGDASIVQSESAEDGNRLTRTVDAEHLKPVDSALGMKIKLLKTGDASIVDSEKKRRQDTESPLEMKIKLSKTGHPTIIAYDSQGEAAYKQKEASDSCQSFAQRYKESGQGVHKEPALKILKTGHSTILQSNRSELTIEPVQMQAKKLDNMLEISPKRKDISISPIESKKPKLEAQLTQILPEVTIQPVASRDQKQFVFDPKTSAISLQQMNVISQEISITQVRPSKSADASLNEKLKDILSKNVSGSPMNSDCEIIEHRPELIIVNENSNSSQDVMIIEEVSPSRVPEVKIPKKRGRPRRNPLPQGVIHQPQPLLINRDPLSLEDMHQMQQRQIPHFESRENERPKRTCRSQKSYAPPKRGRGRGRGKRKLDNADPQMSKKSRIDQDLTKIEASTTAVITIDDTVLQQESFGKSPELYKALKQPTLDAKIVGSQNKVERKITASKNDAIKAAHVSNNTISVPMVVSSEINKDSKVQLKSLEGIPEAASNESKDNLNNLKNKKLTEAVADKAQKSVLKSSAEDKHEKATDATKSESKDVLIPPDHPNWLTPVSKRASENAAKHENVSTVQVIDEETRMSAESGSRSQTPARNIPAQASETIINEESQGSVLSTATTESEKVKVKNRRMEINFDPDEGPFTVDKIAEYEWPLDRKGETFMIQEQISQYLGVKSFKRKYPDLKRRVVDMEERNYLRENGLVSEAMCDMGLTAICSSEVLDVMCSDFPDQYEEYRKHMREKQVKEHSKKQKELTAAANAEKNRIDLAEMAVQSALSWNISLNKARREDRKCSLDLQTFTIHVPKKQQKVEERKVGYYPVALIPGQYTDYYREYTPAELRYYPLNTVLYGPTRPNERKFDSQSEGSQSDNDSDSSSDDSSSSSSEGTQNTEGSQSTMDDVDMEIANQKEEIKLKCKMCLKTLNKHSKNEVLIQCGTCNGHVHPSCIDLTLDMVPHIQSYAWQCTDCKTCAQCHDPADEDKMLFCDMCDRGYHIYCVGLRRVPQGRWHCQECAVCANCASREPGGINSDRNSVAQWQHEYKKGDKNTRVYVSTLCVPCSKLWRKGRYCPHCSRCHTAPRLDLEANLVHCSACDKYLHLDCVETKGVALDRKNYLCDFCAPTRQHMMKPFISKTLRT